MRVLVVEDYIEVGSYIVKGLKESGHTADLAADGKQGLFLTTTEPYDVMILDRMLPHVDGMTIINTLQGLQYSDPCVVLCRQKVRWKTGLAGCVPARTTI